MEKSCCAPVRGADARAGGRCRAGFKDLGMTMTAKQLLKQFTEMDLDDDGAITLDEFIEASFITIAMQGARAQQRIMRRPHLCSHGDGAAAAEEEL